jgi:hypothetical protein
MIYPADVNRVTLLFESGTYATPSGTSGNWLGLVENHEATLSENLIEIRSVGTGNRNYNQMTMGPEDVEGTISYSPQDWRLLGFALGSIVDGGSPTPYTHVLSELNGDGYYAYTSGTSALTNFPSFTIIDSKKGRSDGEHDVKKIYGCVIDSFTITASQGEVVKCEAGYKAQSMAIGSKTADIVSIANEDTSRPYVWSDCALVIGSATTGSSICEATDISFSINNTVEPRHYVCGSRTIQAMVPTNREYELSFTADSTSKWGVYLKEFYKNGSSFNSIFKLVQSVGSEACCIIMSGCKISDFGEPSPAEGINSYSVTIKPQSASASVDDLVFKYNPW